jgi:hypothetical protein
MCNKISTNLHIYVTNRFMSKWYISLVKYHPYRTYLFYLIYPFTSLYLFFMRQDLLSHIKILQIDWGKKIHYRKVHLKRCQYHTGSVSGVSKLMDFASYDSQNISSWALITDQIHRRAAGDRDRLFRSCWTNEQETTLIPADLYERIFCIQGRRNTVSTALSGCNILHLNLRWSN